VVRQEFSALPTAVLASEKIERWAKAPLPTLMAEAARLRDLGHGQVVSYSRKVFIPLTRLCRDTCRYCTFVRGPRGVPSAYLSPDEVLTIARAGVDAGCREALFTLGDKPELKYEAARLALARLGYKTTIDYLAAMCALVLRETGLLPHANPGDERGGYCRAPPGVGVAGRDAGECVAAAWRARRAASRLPRQGAGDAPGNP
jgi:2-iminoacetate synthase ThiH